jgi:SAM-dependent methyltransferase
MSLERVQNTFEILGAEDPFWAVLSDRKRKGNKWDPEVFFSTGQREIESVLRFVKNLGLNLRYGRALDFGCGVGRLSQALAGNFEHVVGVDISRSMLDVARQYNRCGERCQYKLNVTSDLSQFQDDTFDFVYSNITLQHVPPDASVAYVGEFLRVSRPGGVVLFQLPSGLVERSDTWYGRWRSFRMRHLSPLRQRWKALRGIPVIEMHAVDRDTVEQVIEGAGGVIRKVAEDGAAGLGWKSYRYCASKRIRKAA